MPVVSVIVLFNLLLPSEIFCFYILETLSLRFNALCFLRAPSQRASDRSYQELRLPGLAEAPLRWWQQDHRLQRRDERWSQRTMGESKLHQHH